MIFLEVSKAENMIAILLLFNALEVTKNIEEAQYLKGSLILLHIQTSLLNKFMSSGVGIINSIVQTLRHLLVRFERKVLTYHMSKMPLANATIT